jgi:DNA-binding NarL/FixJ family response regulator
LLAQAFEAARRRPQALETLTQALLASQAEGLIRVIADDPWHLEPLFEALTSRQVGLTPTYLRALQEAIVGLQPRTPMGDTSDSSIGDNPLSPRESQLLRLLAEGLTNKELARKLFVTENTVETHLRRIYGKLATRTPTQAVAKARERGLV